MQLGMVDVWRMKHGSYAPALAWLSLSLSACSVTSHPIQPERLGVARPSGALEALIDEPGPLTVESVVSSDWVIDRAGLLNLDHARAKAAQLADGDEPIKIFFHVIKHPERGTFIVDTGVEQAMRKAPDKAVLRGLTASAMHTDRLTIHAPLGSHLRAQQLELAGVFLTHLHADHVMGLPDVARGTPIYVGPGEGEHRALINLVVQPLMNDFLAGHAPLRELRFEPDADQRFAGVLDLFGDGSLWALHTPGHTPGSVAFVARTGRGPVLLTGDNCHTAWGWENDVEPGSFTEDRDGNVRSLQRLRRLAREHPTLDVRLGHQLLRATH